MNIFDKLYYWFVLLFLIIVTQDRKLEMYNGLIKIHFEFRSKHNRYFGQPRVRSMGLPVPTPYPKRKNAVEVEKLSR